MSQVGNSEPITRRGGTARQAAMLAKKAEKAEKVEKVETINGDAKYKKFMADLAKALKEPNTRKVRCGGGGGGYGWKVEKIEVEVEAQGEWESDWESDEEVQTAASSK